MCLCVINVQRYVAIWSIFVLDPICGLALKIVKCKIIKKLLKVIYSLEETPTLPGMEVYSKCFGIF